jgi:hypothetical protein
MTSVGGFPTVLALAMNFGEVEASGVGYQLCDCGLRTTLVTKEEI